MIYNYFYSSSDGLSTTALRCLEYCLFTKPKKKETFSFKVDILFILVEVTMSNTMYCTLLYILLYCGTPITDYIQNSFKMQVHVRVDLKTAVCVVQRT